MGTIEILAPAGSPESLVPAVRLGADAVYLGAKQFSARGNAGNFDREALKEAVEYCHIRGVKIYLAINTLMRDEELQGALALAEYAASLPVDALIVQDVGFASLVRSAAPGPVSYTHLDVYKRQVPPGPGPCAGNRPGTAWCGFSLPRKPW